MSQPVRKVPEDVLAHIHLMSLAFGGIGAGDYTAWDEQDAKRYPLCAHGMCRAHTFAKYNEGAYQWEFKLRGALNAAGISVAENDRAVHRIHSRQGQMGMPAFNPRVSFEDWCAELNVVSEAVA